MSEEVDAARAASNRPVVAWIDLDALESNVALIARLVAPAKVMIVVKADGYGHGALPIAERALLAGASSVAVSVVDEAVDLRERGFSGEVLVLTEADAAGFRRAAAFELSCTVTSASGIAAAARAASATNRRLRLHLKIDTGMHRLGADPKDALQLAEAIVRAKDLELEGLFTHLAVADDVDDPFTDLQLERLDEVVAELEAAGISPRFVHAANSAGAIAHPSSRRDLVRVGIAAYGCLPAPSLDAVLAAQIAPGERLSPVLALAATVQSVRRLSAGERTSYGRRYLLERDSTVVTVPIGYADGLPRSLGSSGGEVLIGGRRCPIAGTVTMDQIVVDVGDDVVHPGDDVVLIGRQGDVEITAWEWAEKSGTIAYEVLARLGVRIPRRLV